MSWQAGLYVAAVLLPLIAFTIELIGIRFLGRLNAYLATAAIGFSCVLAAIGFFDYFFVEAHGVLGTHHVEAAAEPHAAENGAGEHAKGPLVWSASYDWVLIGRGLHGSSAGHPVLPELIIPLAVHIDNLTVIMFLMVTFIATLIHIYSMGYMHDDPRYPRFFTYLSLFCFSMLGLVASANVFMIFMFWELVGVCSYLLIGFWYEEKKNCDAANKAFIVNRVGDVGMLVGLGLLWAHFGTFNFAEINNSLRDSSGRFNVGDSARGDEMILLRDRDTHKDLVSPATGEKRGIPPWLLTIAGLGVFAGCVGKSAQFPLHVWLPDAMAGPTPVSALIHAATMVAAGVYLTGRFFPLFNESVQLWIAYTGGITLLIAATIAMVQTDYKKVLAYSTVSQLGFMMLGLGVGGWAAGLFHLITHAFFKALLFLGAGSVYHAVHTYEMPVLGGLRRKMPTTAYTMLAATLAISGVPFFSGFYSKDAILAASIYFVRHHPGHAMLLLLPVLGATITAFYMFRMWFLVFAGEPRGYPAHGDHGHDHGGHHHGNPFDHAHESPPVMAWPLLILAVPTVVIGWPLTLIPIPGVEAATPVLERLLEYGEPVVRTVELEALHESHWNAAAASALIVIAGVGLGLAYYAPPLTSFRRRPVPAILQRRFEAHKTASQFSGVYRFLVHKWYFDELYNAVLVRPTLALAQLASDFDKQVVDGVVNGSAFVIKSISNLGGSGDKYIVDALVNLTAKIVYAVGDWGRGIQTGRLRNYLMFLVVALVGLFVGVFAWVQP